MTAAAAVQAGEDRLTGLEREQSEVEARERAAAEELDKRRAEMAGTLAALERLGHRPPEALLATPGSPLDNLRSAMLLGAVVPELEKQAAQLATEVEALRTERKQVRSRIEKLLSQVDQLSGA